MKQACIAALFCLSGLGCTAGMSAQEQDERGDASRDSAPDTVSVVDASADVGVLDQGEDQAPDISAPAVIERQNPNMLDQARLFECSQPAAARSSVGRVRRLTPNQYNVRFGSAPFATDERYRYSSDTQDSAIDENSAYMLTQRLHALGTLEATRRIGWSSCMRRLLSAPEGMRRPDQACVRSWSLVHLKRVWQRDVSEEEITAHVDFTISMMDKHGPEQGLEVAAALPYGQSDALFKQELGQGPEDEHGRRFLGSWPAALAVVAAITDMALVRWYRTNDVDDHMFEALDALRVAVEDGSIQSAQQLQPFIDSLLDASGSQDKRGYDVSSTNIERFFREYLGYDRAEFVFKSGGILPRDQPYIYPKLGSDNHRQISNLWTTVAHAMGVPLEGFGDQGALRVTKGPLSEVLS